MLADWISDHNVEPFAETLSGFIGYSFDAWDRDAIRHGVEETDVEANRWYAYELAGERLVKLAPARDPGSSVVFVRVQAHKDLEGRAEVAVGIMQAYRLSGL